MNHSKKLTEYITQRLAISSPKNPHHIGNSKLNEKNPETS